MECTNDGLYDLIHDNIEMLKLLHFDCSVYKRFMKHQKFRCANTYKESENLECLSTPVTYTQDLELHLIQCKYQPHDTVSYVSNRVYVTHNPQSTTGSCYVEVPFTNRKLQCRILKKFKILIQAEILNNDESWFQWRRMVTSIAIADASKQTSRNYIDVLYDDIMSCNYQRHHFALVSCLKPQLHKIMYLFSMDESRNDEVVRSFYDDMKNHKYVAFRAT